MSGLVPQDPLQVGGPGFLGLHAGSPEGVRVLPLPPAEPDLKAQAADAGVVRHPDVAGLRGGRETSIRDLRGQRSRAPRRPDVRADLERLFVDVNVAAYVCLLGLAEEDEIFEEKDPPHTFLLPEENRELVLANQLALLLQIHLGVVVGG